MSSVDLQEKANFSRLSGLLIGKGTEALRNTFDGIHPPATLTTVLAANRTSLLRLKPRVINYTQWDLLYPPTGKPPDSKTFDVTLLTILFRNICGLPSTGWGPMPAHTDRSLQANILRIKFYRNEVHAHVTSTQVDNATFESLWKKITQTLVELKVPKNDVDDVRTCPLGPEEEAYAETLKEWKSQDEECIKVLERLNDDVKSVKSSIERLEQTIEDQCDNVKSVKSSIKRLKQTTQDQSDNVKSVKSSIKRLKQTTEDQCSDVKSVKSSIERLEQTTKDKCDEVKQLYQSTLERQSDNEPPQSSITRTPLVFVGTNVKSICDRERDEDLLRKLAKHNFKSKIKSKVKSFLSGTREWLLKRVDEFVTSDHESKILLLTAGPGFGKSVFAAKVCEGFKTKGKLAASHFCDFGDSNLRDPLMMLQSLASQMCENIVGFKEKLLDQLRRPHQVRSLKDAFGIYLQNPLDELELDEPSVIVIDALDESAADNMNEIVNLIADCFSDLPDCVKVLVTSRPEISLAKLSSVRKINIANDDAGNKSDLHLYFKVRLPKLAEEIAEINDDLSPDDVFKILVEKCEGSFLYAFYVQSELQKHCENKMRLYEIISFLPQGLDSVYQTYFKRLEDELKAVLYQNFNVFRILEILAASKGTLPLTFVANALGLAPDCRETKNIISKVNERVSCLLYVSNDMVTVFHKSVIDWLLVRGYQDHEYAVQLTDGNRSLWLQCEHVLEEIKEKACSGHDLNLSIDMEYALGHGLWHILACNMYESFFWLVDVVIVHRFLSINNDRQKNFRSSEISKLWRKALQGAAAISDGLRARISWHIVEIDFILNFLRGLHHFSITFSSCYLQSVLTHSPMGYFSDNEKKTVEFLLSKVPQFVEFNFYEVEVMPRAIFYPSVMASVTAVGVSHAKTMAAYAQRTGIISVVSVPRLTELWEYSTQRNCISCCTFAPDDSLVLFGKLETVLSIAERREVPFFHGNEELFRSCAFSPNGKRLVTCNGSNTIKLWDVVKKNLLSELCAEVPVFCCSFSSTGLFITGCNHAALLPQPVVPKDLFCVWNAITWQRSDERSVKQAEPDVCQMKKCKRCCLPGFKGRHPSKGFEIRPSIAGLNPVTTPTSNLPTGAYTDVDCIFDQHFLSLRECTHLTKIAASNHFVDFPPFELAPFYKTIAIKDDLWLCVDSEKLVFSTLAPVQEKSSFFPLPTRIISSSFSPDGSRLATCTSDGCINIWNVFSSQVEQSFKSNQSGSSSPFCWWADKFLFVIFSIDKVPNLSKYPVDDNLKVDFTHSQQVSLCHLVDEFVAFTAVVDFSEGLLSFVCRKTNPVKVLDVSEGGMLRMVTLPGILSMTGITASPGASFVFCGNQIWKRNAEEPASYKLFFTVPTSMNGELVCCFSNDSEVAVVTEVKGCFWRPGETIIIDLNMGNHRSLGLDILSMRYIYNCFCTKNEVFIVVTDRAINFFGINSGTHLQSSFQRYLTGDSLWEAKLSPSETVLAFHNINGDMVFLRLCIPPKPMLSSIR